MRIQKEDTAVAVLVLSCCLEQNDTPTLHIHTYKDGDEVSRGWMWGINTAASPAAVLLVWTVADGKAAPFGVLYLPPIYFTHPSHTHTCSLRIYDIALKQVSTHIFMFSTVLPVPRPWLCIYKTSNCVFNTAGFVVCRWQCMWCTEAVCCVVRRVFSYAALFI